MSNEEIAKEIDEATRLLKEGMRKIRDSLNIARDIANKENTVDTEAYNKGLNDAWELAKKLWHNDVRTNDDIYGIEYFIGIANDYTPQEALAKLEAYEKEQNIKVGDVVETEDCNGVVIDQYADDRYYILTENGCVEDWCYAEMAKTGKHIDISSILQQIGGDADELS